MAQVWKVRLGALPLDTSSVATPSSKNVDALGVLINSAVGVIGITLIATKRYTEAYTLGISAAIVGGIVAASRVWTEK